jgi:hypothetical protein
MSTIETDTDRRLEQEMRLRGQAAPDDGDAQAIERNIDATRADMRATLEALERRFSFDRLVDLTVGRIRDRGGEFAGNLTDAAARNPVPLLLTSIGIGWMMLTSRRSADGASTYSGDGGRIGERMRNARDRVSSTADRIRGAAESTRDTWQEASESARDGLHRAADSLRGAAESSRDTFEHTAESLRSGADSLRSGATRAAAATREQIEYARSRVDRLLDEQPLMLGAIGLAAGAIIGALLPTTEQEDRYLGDARDKVLKNVAEKSRMRFEAASENAATRSASDDTETSGTGEGASREQAASRPH